MKRISKKHVTLAIETTFGSGSLSFLSEGKEIDFLICHGEKLKADEILLHLSKLLEKTGLQKDNIESIVFAGGVGSRTGIRIGAATSLGLKLALGCGIKQVSVLEALILESFGVGFVQTAIGVSEKEIYRQIILKNSLQEFSIASFPEILTAEEFFLGITDYPETVFLSDKNIFARQILEQNKRTETNKNKGILRHVNFSENIAGLVGLYSNFIKFRMISVNRGK